MTCHKPLELPSHGSTHILTEPDLLEAFQDLCSRFNASCGAMMDAGTCGSSDRGHRNRCAPLLPRVGNAIDQADDGHGVVHPQHYIVRYLAMRWLC